MSIKIGGLDVTSEIVELHFQLRRTQILLERVLDLLGDSVVLTPSDMQIAEDNALNFVKNKFPDMGIVKK
jgi:hypothetical protein